jgi:hypothetical protein
MQLTQAQQLAKTTKKMIATDALLDGLVRLGVSACVFPTRGWYKGNY